MLFRVLGAKTCFKYFLNIFFDLCTSVSSLDPSGECSQSSNLLMLVSDAHQMAGFGMHSTPNIHTQKWCLELRWVNLCIACWHFSLLMYKLVLNVCHCYLFLSYFYRYNCYWELTGCSPSPPPTTKLTLVFMCLQAWRPGSCLHTAKSLTTTSGLVTCQAS